MGCGALHREAVVRCRSRIFILGDPLARHSSKAVPMGEWMHKQSMSKQPLSLLHATIILLRQRRLR